MAEIDSRSGGPQCILDILSDPLVSPLPPPSSPKSSSSPKPKVDPSGGISRRHARVLVDRAVNARVALLGESDLCTASAMNAMGELLLYDGEVAEARRVLDIAQSIRHSVLSLLRITLTLTSIVY